jgi:hypothetical protein
MQNKVKKRIIIKIIIKKIKYKNNKPLCNTKNNNI